MPYDFYDYFLKQRKHPFFTETTNIVRQKFWRESFDVVKSQEWENITNKIRKN